MPKSIRHKLSKPHQIWGGSLRSVNQEITMDQYGLAANLSALEFLTESLVRSIATRPTFSDETGTIVDVDPSL